MPRNKKKISRVKGSHERPRVTFSESNRYLRVQAIDDTIGNTLASATTENLNKEGNNYSRSFKNAIYAKKLGEMLAKELKKKGKIKIVFDCNSRPYHGKIKIFCETMRQLGINF
ncbi:50S ribosomal protein L18 [endosymbiont GvMRE of Glomus versiforme]|uniref:50S ribosomal protein L18 n=1 Tax=endosymbiont GvMRE of Glomus versiforme TaxID=2039283 RepID=UPI000EC81520|nr:50S ribosomal protein L18 [endosymbiont GvMRE of Glomus versiforme]RHZ35624.1 50S ribosomal protein L18 [endosymbiont GvMRE of Glomus versiforme]